MLVTLTIIKLPDAITAELLFVNSALFFFITLIRRLYLHPEFSYSKVSKPLVK